MLPTPENESAHIMHFHIELLQHNAILSLSTHSPGDCIYSLFCKASGEPTLASLHSPCTLRDVTSPGHALTPRSNEVTVPYHHMPMFDF